MGELLSALVAGVLSNLISDSISTNSKYVLSKREMDLELRRAVEILQRRQLNLEGAIEQLVNNQKLLLSVFCKLINSYHLTSSVYVENNNIIIVPNLEDAKILKNPESDAIVCDPPKDIVEDKFASYREYVKKMRGEE